MTKIKIISVLAVALMLTALGASAALAWGPIQVAADCHTVTISSEDKFYSDHPDQTVVFTSGSKKLEADVHFASHSGSSVATVDVAATGLTPATWSVGFKGTSDVSASVVIPSCPQPAPTCPTETLQISDVSAAGDKLDWTIHNSNTTSVNFNWNLKEDTSVHGAGTVAAGADEDVTTDTLSGTTTLFVVALKIGGVGFCQHVEKSYSAATPPPTAPAETPTPSATAQPTETAQPTSTASALPAPPTTGQGSNGGDNSFAIFLMAGVLTTLVVGGTTLALSRKGN